MSAVTKQPEPTDRAAFCAALPLAEGIQARLDAYVAALVKWTRAINLVAPGTIPQLWMRHILDSAQIFALLPSGTARLIDLGSGAGLPGLVLAILGVPEVHLVESDQRKATFLREAARLAGVQITVHAARIEDVTLPPADVVTARALAPLDRLIPLSQRFCGPDTVCLFPKGRDAAAELTAAQASWTMEILTTPSRTDPEASILRLSRIRPR